jgi:hypothetical protein
MIELCDAQAEGYMQAVGDAEKRNEQPNIGDLAPDAEG